MRAIDSGNGSWNYSGKFKIKVSPFMNERSKEGMNDIISIIWYYVKFQISKNTITTQDIQNNMENLTLLV
jgi:hypothetical protein